MTKLTKLTLLIVFSICTTVMTTSFAASQRW
jgi:hypothetical protein